MSDQPTSPSLSERTRRWIPLFVFLLALVIRLPGLTWGLMDGNHNQSLHPDEEVNWRYSQQIKPAEFHFTPGFYNYGTLYLTALRVSSDITAAYTGKPTNPSTDWDYIRRCEFAGRFISLLSGAGLAVCVYLMATRFTSAIGSFSAALAIIVAPALVVHSRFATVDMLSVFLVSWSMLFAIKLYYEADASTKELWRWALLSGVLAGLSAGTKYSGGLAVLMPLVALFLRKPLKWPVMAAATFAATIISFLISTPGALLENEAFMRDFKFESVHTAAGHGIVFVGTSVGYLFHLSNLALGQGLLLLLLGLGGLIYALVKKQPWAMITVALWLPYYLLIGGAEVKFMRYTFPLMIGTSLAVGFAVGEGHRLKGKGAIAVVIGILGFGGFAGGGLRGTASFSGDMLGLDNREVAAKYIKDKATDATVAGVARDPWYWSATLFPDSALTRMFPFSTRYQVMTAATKPKVVQYVSANPDERLDWDSRLLTEMRPEYVVFSDLESLDVQRLAKMSNVPEDNQAVVAQYKAFESELEKDYTLDKQIGEQTDLVEDMRYVAPAVYIWKRKGS